MVVGEAQDVSPAESGWDVPCGNVVLQLGLAFKRGRDSLLGEFDYLGVGFASGGPALYIGRLGPPTVHLVMMEDSYGIGHFKR